MKRVANLWKKKGDQFYTNVKSIRKQKSAGSNNKGQGMQIIKKQPTNILSIKAKRREIFKEFYFIF